MRRRWSLNDALSLFDVGNVPCNLVPMDICSFYENLF